MNIPAAHRDQIVARYYGQKAIYTGKYILPEYMKQYCDENNMFEIKGSLISTVDGMLFSLAVKPLSKISDEHAIEVAKIGISTKANVEFKITRGSIEITLDYQELYAETSSVMTSYFRIFYCGTMTNGSMFNAPLALWEAYQYLQCLGYALPQTVVENGKPITYTVDQLVEAGVYKLLEE
jgi:hypothetical protein